MFYGGYSMVDFFKGTPCIIKKNLSIFRKFNIPAPLHEQRCADFFLNAKYGLCKSRLCDMQMFSGPGVVLVFSCFKKVFQMLVIHTPSYFQKLLIGKKK